MRNVWLGFFFVWVLSFIGGCATTAAKEGDPGADPFTGMQGCFLLYNVKTATFERVIGEATCRERFPAASTFKVPLAVMAFDSGILKDENVVLKWDGKKRARDVLNHDHNAKTWMRDSVVWFSQRLTPKLGEKRLQKYLDAFDYGNRDLGAGILEAWLVSPALTTSALRISAYEQIEFMKKLWADKLPASKRAMQLTREITFLEKSPNGFRLHGKTGSNSYDDANRIQLGWFIAHVANADREYLAVTCFHDLAPAPSDTPGGLRAKAITKRLLGELGLW